MSYGIWCDNYESEDCWYARNLDRIQEYKKTYHFVVNHKNEERNTEDVYYCNVCYKSGTGEKLPSYDIRCHSCRVRMADEWLKINENERYCRACVDVVSVKDIDTIDHARLMKRSDVIEQLEQVTRTLLRGEKREKK